MIYLKPCESDLSFTIYRWTVEELMRDLTRATVSLKNCMHSLNNLSYHLMHTQTLWFPLSMFASTDLLAGEDTKWRVETFFHPGDIGLLTDCHLHKIDNTAWSFMNLKRKISYTT